MFFTGEIRGDNSSWLLLRENLIEANNADVIFDLWTGEPEKEALLKIIFRPCAWFTEPYDAAYVERVQANEPRFKFIDGNLYAIGKGETIHVVDSFYRTHHAMNKSRWDLTEGSVLVRARLDQYFGFPVKIPLEIPQGALYLPSLSLHSQPSCPMNANDLFAFGDYAAMSIYFDVFPHMFDILAAMKKNPGYTEWWNKTDLERPQEGKFRCDSEGFLGWHLRMNNVSCLFAPQLGRQGTYNNTLVRKVNDAWLPQIID